MNRHGFLVFFAFLVGLVTVLTFAVVVFADCVEVVRTKHYLPYISKDIEGPDRCSEDDPLGPCYGRLVTVTNPKKTSQVVEVECRPNLVTARSVIGPGRQVTFDLGHGNGFLSKDQCVIKKCYRWRGEPVEP
jgi:hypothetical protein